VEGTFFVVFPYESGIWIFLAPLLLLGVGEATYFVMEPLKIFGILVFFFIIILVLCSFGLRILLVLLACI
jgi:hypothetical protein